MAPTAKNSDAELFDFYREHGLRLTAQRKTILKVLQAADEHPDAVELHRLASQIDSSISLATVYRTVALLAEKGLLEKHVFADGRARYETAHAAHHDHFVDVDSGEVTEFHSDELERLQEELAKQHGFEIVEHNLVIYVRRRKASN